MTQDIKDVLKLALDALEKAYHAMQTDMAQDQIEEAITAIKEALREHAMREVQRLGQEIEQEPVAWLITDEKINSIQVNSIQRLIDRAKHAHMTDIKLRINGQDEWYEADWLKHLTRTTPPQRTWVELTDEEYDEIWRMDLNNKDIMDKTIAKLKELNT